jgi:hypothetical protein
MSFFSNNPVLKEEFHNPKVEQIYNPDYANQPLSENIFGQGPLGELSNLVGGNNSANGGYNVPWMPEDINLGGTGSDLSGLSGAPWSPLAGTQNTTPATGMVTGQATTTGGGDGGGTDIFGGDTDYFGNPLGATSLTDLAISLSRATGLQNQLLNAAIPFGGMLSSGIQYLTGVTNPLYNTPIGDLLGLGDNPTSSWYGGDTNDLGFAITDWESALSYGGYADPFEQAIAADAYNDWDTYADDLMDAIEQDFANQGVDLAGDNTPEPTIDDLMSGMGDAGSMDSSSSSGSSDTSGFGGYADGTDESDAAAASEGWW